MSKTNGKMPISDSEVIASADAGSLVEVIDTPRGGRLRYNNHYVKYLASGTVDDIVVEVHDVDSGSAVGDTTIDGAEYIFVLSPGDEVSEQELAINDFDNDVCVVVDRAGDGVDSDVVFNAGGFNITA